jgi:hypothetical protein
MSPKGFNFGDGPAGLFGDPKKLPKPKKRKRKLDLGRVIGLGGGAPAETRFLLDEFVGALGVNVTARQGEIGGPLVAHPTSSGNALLTGTGRAYINVTAAPHLVGPVAPVNNYRVILTAIRRSANTDFGCGPTGRANNAAPLTWYYMHYNTNTNQIQLYKTVAGVDTILATVGYAWAAEATHVMELKMVGDQITCLVDDAVIIGPVTDASIASGRPGMRMFAGGGGGGGTLSAGMHIEKLEAYPL